MRLLGIDDGPFSFTDATVPVIGVLQRIDGHVDGVVRTDVTVDGTDSTEALVQMIARSRFADQPTAILLDGAALGGFNVVDLPAVHQRLHLPVISVTRDRPDLEAIAVALRRRFGEQGPSRLALMASSELEEVTLPLGVLWCRFVGIDGRFGSRLLLAATSVGLIPSPLRLAHLIATAVVSGSSHGAA